MKRIYQINDRRRALKLPKRSQFEIATSSVVFCKSCFLVLRKGQQCPFCKLDVLPSLRPYQRAALDFIAKDLFCSRTHRKTRPERSGRAVSSGAGD